MINTPWTDEQVASLNAFQQHGMWHPFTCPNDSSDLIATKNGWKCSKRRCTYTQQWAHDFMLNWSWKTDSDKMEKQLKQQRPVLVKPLPRKAIEGVSDGRVSEYPGAETAVTAHTDTTPADGTSDVLAWVEGDGSSQDEGQADPGPESLGEAAEGLERDDSTIHGE